MFHDINLSLMRISNSHIYMYVCIFMAIFTYVCGVVLASTGYAIINRFSYSALCVPCIRSPLQYTYAEYGVYGFITFTHFQRFATPFLYSHISLWAALLFTRRTIFYRVRTFVYFSNALTTITAHDDESERKKE